MIYISFQDLRCFVWVMEISFEYLSHFLETYFPITIIIDVDIKYKWFVIQTEANNTESIGQI